MDLTFGTPPDPYRPVSPPTDAGSISSPVYAPQAGEPGYAPAPEPYHPPLDEQDSRLVCLDDSLRILGPSCVIPAPTPTPEEPDEPGEQEAPPSVVTLTDIASFSPSPTPAVATEPDGIGAARLPLNTIATSSSQTVDGELFGYPVTVTFTPAGFGHDWGDGTTAQTRDGGATWDALRLEEYTPTATSHAYEAKGTYDLAVTALYSAMVDFGVWGTRAVDGVIEAPSASRPIRIVEVHTALVQHDCLEDPSGPGCPGT